MNTAVVGRGLATGWRGLLITAAVIAGSLVLGLAVYRDLDLSIYENLPEAVRSLLGVPPKADAALLAYNEMLASLGALALVGVAIAVGTQTIAGEENDRTLHVTLATPVTRTSYLLSRATAMILLLLAAGALLLGAAEIAPVLLGIEAGEAHLFALIAHLTGNAILHASLALAVGAATGRKGLAAGVATSVMLFGWLGSGLLPLWREDAADWIPWTWFNGSKPLVNGIDARQLALLIGCSVVFIALGALGFRRRELRLTQAGPSLLDRLRGLPGAGRLFASTARGSSLLGLRLATGQVLMAYVIIIMGVVMGVTMPLMYESLDAMMGDFAATFPQTMVALFGGGGLETPSGFLHLETFGMMAPAAVILVATAASASGIAGEERARRMSVLLAQPVSRQRVYWTVALTMAIYVALVSLSLFLGNWAGIAIAGLDIPLADLGWACGLLTLLGWFFGALALVLSAATGRSSLAVWGATGIAVASFFGYTLLLAAGREELGWWSPFRAYLDGPPLMHGIAWWQPVWLLIGTAVLLGLGLPALLRRDIRITAG